MSRRYRMAPWARMYFQGRMSQRKPCRRPPPHRAWGARQMDQITDIQGWRHAVAFLRPLIHGAAA